MTAPSDLPWRAAASVLLVIVGVVNLLYLMFLQLAPRRRTKARSTA